MKHIMPIMKFAYDKIVNGTKHIEMRLWDSEHQKIHLNDVIEFVCNPGGDKVMCLVRGLVVCERFDDIIDLLPLKFFGYANKEEVKVRINRCYTFEEQLTNDVVGILIMPLHVEEAAQRIGDENDDKTRNVGLELENSRVKDYSKIYMARDRGNADERQRIEHVENEDLDEDEKLAELNRMRYQGYGRDD